MAAAFAHHILLHSKPYSSAAFFISCNKTITKTKNGFYTLLPFIHRRHKTLAAAATDSLLELGGVKISKQDVVKDEPTNNVPDLIFTKLGLQLHRRDNHPLGILKNAIYEYFDTNYNNQFQKFDDLCPIVTTKMNFDDVLVPADHVSRSYNDTYYVDADTVLRCHTSAHQATLLREGYANFLVTGDVYRRDSIDSTHYPVFHQMEGVRVFNPSDWNASGMDGTLYAAQELKACLEGLARHLFGAVEMRWVDTYFPFTNPSFELEIYFQEKWLEVLGCGVMEQEILKRGGKTDNVAWAFGLGLERLAMVLFDIPDIRLFWSTDKRFTSQFTKGQLGIKFKPFSKTSLSKAVIMTPEQTSLSWKEKIDCFPCREPLKHGKFLNGALHWATSDGDILSLDLGKETYGDFLKLPYDKRSKRLTLGLFGEWLCVLCNYPESESREGDAWMMKDYGVQDSWTKLRSISHPNDRFSSPSYMQFHALLCVSYDKKLLLQRGAKLDVYDCINGSYSEIQNFDGFREAYIIVESLVWPDFGDGKKLSDKVRGQKRKFVDFDDQTDPASVEKRLAGSKLEHDDTSNATDGTLSNEDLQRIKELR